ncbi:hTAFII28-like protein conserved region-domain-containing protein [Limtongia smithiae]|uniref:hTAFII28-like protein conserved region-domain-containing protein n=1 Tax=Limtongia smithiae TaxID=1125753 RepID=UPI0034CFAA90
MEHTDFTLSNENFGVFFPLPEDLDAAMDDLDFPDEPPPASTEDMQLDIEALELKLEETKELADDVIAAAAAALGGVDGLTRPGLQADDAAAVAAPKKAASSMTQAELHQLISSFTDDQMDRYETFRRANVNRGGVKKLANAVLAQSISNNVAIAISGFSKVFLGEVIERALDVQKRMDPLDPTDPFARPGPLLPIHIREAWRLYKRETGLVPAAHWRRAGGQGDGRLFR